MPYVTTSLRVPNYSSAPASPSVGQVYYDTTKNGTYYWNGTAWSTFGPEAYTGTTAPSPRGDIVFWVDTSLP